MGYRQAKRSQLSRGSARKRKYGANKLREKKKKTAIQRFLHPFKDVTTLILIAAAIISFVLVCAEKTWGELFKPALIVLIVIFNAALGVYQESKAEKALDALKNISATHARVIRDGEEKSSVPPSLYPVILFVWKPVILFRPMQNFFTAPN